MRSLRFLTLFLLILALSGSALLLLPSLWGPSWFQAYYYSLLGEPSYQEPPPSKEVSLGLAEPLCPDDHPEWRKRQEMEGIVIEESPVCSPDNPAEIAAFVRGTNRISPQTLMQTNLAPDAVVKGEDRDGDGDPDVIHIRLEVVELNGHSPDLLEPLPSYFIAPGIQPGFWVFAPKTRGMATRTFEDLEAASLLRLPSPVIRVEQGDLLRVTLENTHYMPHTIHFHGVDHPYSLHEEGNDGVPETSEVPVMPGKSRTYGFAQTGHGEVGPGQSRVFEVAPRQPGTMFYHCHVQPQHHIPMGLQGLFVVEENRPNNWVQTLNIGAGQVRYPSRAVRETYTQEYDLHFQDVDPTLNNIIQRNNDPRLVEKAMNRQYNVTGRRPRYFLLNGRSFPYTFREALVVVRPDEKVKLRVLCGSEEGLALHSHGHKVTLTHYDGVEHNPLARITRDVVWLSMAQRVDLELLTVNDGLHSYGEGVWLLHDHKEKAFTTDGIHPGGAVTAIVYRSYLDESGWPQVQGVDWTPFFTKEYYEKKVPVWAAYDEEGTLGEVEAQSFPAGRAALLGFFLGLLSGSMGLFVYSFVKRTGRR